MTTPSKPPRFVPRLTAWTIATAWIGIVIAGLDIGGPWHEAILLAPGLALATLLLLTDPDVKTTMRKPKP